MDKPFNLYKTLKLYKNIGSSDAKNEPFPNKELQAELYSYQYDAKRMGEAPTINATIMYPICLDKLWNRNVYVTFRGERYYIDLLPSSAYSNQDARYKHEVIFVSERKVLENTYFKDVDGITTSFRFFGDLTMLVERLNVNLRQYGYTCYFNSEDIKVEEKDIDISNIKLNEALQKGFEIFGIPYYFVGKDIFFGYYEHKIEEPFEYGINNELLSVNKDNKNEDIVTRITGLGSSENIPHYYPNLTESGLHHLSTNPASLINNIKNVNYLKLDSLSNLRRGDTAIFLKKSENTLEKYDPSYIHIYTYAHADNKEVKNIGPENLENYKSYEIDYGYRSIKDLQNPRESAYTKFNLSIYMPDYETDVSLRLSVKYILSEATWNTNYPYTISQFYVQSNSTDYTVSNTINTSGDIDTNIITELNFHSIGGYYEFSLFYPINIESSQTNTKGSAKVIFTPVLSINNYATNFTYVGSGFINKGIEKSIYTQSVSKDDELGSVSYSGHFNFSFFRPISGYTNATAIPIVTVGFYDNNNKALGTKTFYPEITSITIDGTGWNKYEKKGNTLRVRNNTNKLSFLGVGSDCRLEYTLKVKEGQNVSYVKMEYNPMFTLIDREYDSFYLKNADDIYKDIWTGIEFYDKSIVNDLDEILFGETYDWIDPKPNLLPSKYRDTLGKKIFYDALNNTYKNENGNFITFKNTIDPSRPKELIADIKEDIKPTIVGMTNEKGQRFDTILDIAFDTNDNNYEWEKNEDETNKTLVHSFFFIKLPQYSGDFGFNLFDQALAKGEMMINMTSGLCGSCNFKIMVNDDGQNVVQVDENGNLVRDENGNVKFGAPQDIQQDTSKAEVWLCLLKEEDSYGVILPDKIGGIVPVVGDTFVISNISLPAQYILDAEKKLESELIKDMLKSNEDKFNFSIDFSRIYVGEHPNILDVLNENSEISIKYNGDIIPLKVSSFSYQMENECTLPKIKVELSDDLYIIKNIIDRTTDRTIKILTQEIRTQYKEQSPTRGGSTIDTTSNIEILQDLGESKTSVMSQKAVTDAIKEVMEKSNVTIVQSTGNSDTDVMSQKAVTEAINKIYSTNDFLLWEDV